MTREAFFIKHIFPKPEIFAWLIKQVEDQKITRYTARKLLEEHRRQKRAFWDKVFEDYLKEQECPTTK